MGLQIEGAVLTHVGRVRSNNEDNYNLFGKYRQNTEVNLQWNTETVCLGQAAAGVFDGMGGEEAGEVASLMAAVSFTPCGLDRIAEEAKKRIWTINDEICKEMKKRGGIRMGATMAALYLEGDQAVSCNVGDSRCYLMRKGQLCQLSTDHNEARKMVELGILTPDEARHSMSRHRLTQHLGIHSEEFLIEPYFSPAIKLQPGDIFLLCSDGLTDMVEDEEIKKILSMFDDAESMGDILVTAALRHGGQDNVTALVLLVKEDDNSASRSVRCSFAKIRKCILSYLSGHLSI